MLRLFSVLLLCLCSAFAQDEGKLLGEFHKDFRGSRNKPPTVEQRQQALATLRGLDSAKLAEELVAAWLDVQDELAAVEQAHAAALAEMADLVRGQEASERRELPKPKFDRLAELKQLTQQQREQADGLRPLLVAVAQRLQQVTRRDALLFLLQKVVGQKKHPLPLKLAAARAIAGGAAELVDELATALARAKEPEDQLALLDALALAGPAARAQATPAIELLQSKDEAVRERAALALAKLAVPGAIAPMIDLLARSSGQTALRIAAALEVLTGQQFGGNVAAWQGWYQAEGKAIASSDGLGKGVPSSRKETNKNYYFGIPQDQSSSILYVIDCSGSMSKEIELNLGGTTAGGLPAKTTRLEGCKSELIRALGLLRPEQRFGILWYNDLPHLWEPKMQPASKEAVLRAQAFVATLKPASTTNIFDSLHQCFDMVGRGVRDKYYGVELDTIFLLTDGSPTRPDGQLDSTDKILLGVREWNPLHRVTIHTIGIGRELNAPFLQQLARENGGEFKQF